MPETSDLTGSLENPAGDLEGGTTPQRSATGSSAVPRSGRGKDRLPRQDAANLQKRMTDEYKILQEKIDKIGGFRFTIKGWAVTAVIAATAAASATKSLTAALVVSSGLAILVYFFFRFEVEQVRLSRLFGFLAGNIEQAFDDIDRGTLRRSFSSPLVATEIVRSKQIKNRPNRFKWWMFWRYVGARHHSARKAWWKDITENWSVWKSAHATFYLFLLVLAFVPVAARYEAVMMHLTDAWSYLDPSPPAPPAPPRPPTGDITR